MAGIEARTLAIFVNEASGLDSKEDASDRLRQHFPASIWNLSIQTIGRGIDLTELASAKVAQGYGIVAGAGGDGTLRAVASAVAGSESAFGVLPVGTLNHFARDLDIPLDLDAAADVIAMGTPVRVDVGEANGWLFLNNAVFGLYPWYRAVRDGQESQGRPKLLAILTALWRVFRINPVHRVELTAGGIRVVRTTSYILVANNRHAMEGYQLGTRERLNEGKLYVYLMKRQSRAGLLLLVLKLLLGRFRTGNDFEVFATEEVSVGTRRSPVDVSLDGEIVSMQSPVTFYSRPSALKVIVPRRT